ncbi:MAG: hypothetical protein STSR0004_14970 [Peptococcaceae bacterium]
MKDLPENWIICMLNELLVSLESGSRPRGGVQGIREGIPSIGGEHLTYNGGFNFNSIKFVPQDFANKMSKGHIKKNDVLIVKDGATTGKTAFVDENFPHEKAVVNEHVFICRTTELISPRFLFRYLISEKGKNEILKNFQGSAQGGINSSFVSNTKVPLAPLNEQRRIVDKLEKLLARVSNCKERLDKIPGLLKRFRQSVLAAACSGRLTADWREKNPDVEPSPELLKRINEERAMVKSAKIKLSKKLRHQEENSFVIVDLPSLPLKWIWCRLGAMVQVNPRHPCDILPENAEVSFVPMSNIDENTWKFKNIQTRLFGEVRKGYTHFTEGDVLFAKITPCMENGKAAIAQNLINGVGCGTTELHVLRPHKYILAEFIYHYIHQELFREKAKLQMTGTAGQLRVPVNFINLSPIPIPPTQEQQEIVRRVDALFKIADQVEARYQKARAYVDKLTQSILAKAFRGELVPRDPADEPASILLERIRKERAGQELESLQKGNGRRKNPARRRKKAGKT